LCLAVQVGFSCLQLSCPGGEEMRIIKKLKGEEEEVAVMITFTHVIIFHYTKLLL
jgi:hypothetical protein